MSVVSFPDPNSPLNRDDEDAEDSGLGGKMSFLEHLEEFRKRLINSFIALGVGVAISFLFIDRIFEFIMVPLQQMLPQGNQLIYTVPTEAFLLKLKLALLVGLLLAGPAIMLQLWLFVAPGLYSNEKKFAVPFIVFMTTGLVGGAAFSHYIVFPVMWRFLASFDNGEYLQFTPRISDVFSLYTRMILASAIVFQMPTFVFTLARMGVVSARWLLKQFKYAVLLNFIVAAAVTPSPDPVSQMLVAGPMCALYLISILIAWAFGKKKARSDSED